MPRLSGATPLPTNEPVGAESHKFKPIDKTSLSEEIASQIMGLISTGDLLPGQKLPSERELRVRFGVGRSSLREALRCLTIVGVLETRVGEGTFLALNRDKFIGKVLEWRVATERRNVENLMKVRLALETETASNAALHASKEQLQELEAALAKMRGSLGNPQQFVADDIAFHLCIAKVSSNDLIFDLLSLIRSQVQRALHALGNWPGATQTALDEHRGILDAIGNHDPESARALMREHINAGLKRYQQAS
jgi:GntR family transcriptional regulator, transcriptional repressor for pyruvate dehydrogenase complex